MFLNSSKENNIPAMVWPANSPDLNLIENLWRDLKHRFYMMWKELRSSPSACKASVDNYKAMIEQCWYEQNKSLIKSLLQKMPQRCADVIAAKGGHTGY
jgi:DNA-binding transcriptional regulator YbjK